jgi:polyisoprenoid-binding protein YceI
MLARHLHDRALMLVGRPRYRAIFSAAATIDREDWGLTWNMVLDIGGLLVSKRIRLEIELELVHQA